MEVSDQMKNNGEMTSKGYSCTQIILGVIMLVIGMKYQPSAPGSGSLEPTISEETAAPSSLPNERDPCPNGAAYYLYVAGISILVTNLVSISSRICKCLAELDGKITSGEKCGLGLLGCASCILAIVDIVMLIWGSVVVFGAWSTWTYDKVEYDDFPEKYNYCAYEPMMFAFVILIIKWVLIPVMITFLCCCTCLCACLASLVRDRDFIPPSETDEIRKLRKSKP